MSRTYFFLCTLYCFVVTCVDVYMGIRWELTYETESNPVGKLLISWFGVGNFLTFRLVTSAVACIWLAFVFEMRHHKRWIRQSAWIMLALMTFGQTLLLVHFYFQGVLI